MNRQKKADTFCAFNIKRTLIIGLLVYLFIIVSFYFLAGEQLKIRDSRGNIEMQPAEYTVGELTEGIVLEQTFSAKIQRLESVSVQWAYYGRKNYGNMTMQLLRASDSEMLMQGVFDVSGLTDYQYVTISSPEPLENVYDTPLTLKVYADSNTGSAGSLMLCYSAADGNISLKSNGENIEGILCMEAKGTDYIWIGLNYWCLASGLGILLALIPITVWLRVRKGKYSYINNAIFAIKKYGFLIGQLVSRDFKIKYKRSILGVFWSFLNPLLMMLIQYYVFSTIFNNDIPFFAAYLIIGTVMFNFFSEAAGMALTSILGNANLVTKVHVPKYIYPFSRILSSLVNLAISLIPMIIVCLITGVQIKISVILALYYMICLVVFSLGIGFMLSTSMVFFRDTQFLWNVLNMMWMYGTPLFYPERIIPENLRFILEYNPLYYFIKNARICILNGVSPEPFVYVQCMLVALGTLLVGAMIFQKNQDKFILYL